MTEQESVPPQFRRTAMMIGKSGIEKLRKSTVLIAGMGAVGSFATESLARAGVGTFRLVDFDIIQPSNINRQLFAHWGTLGEKKTEAARRRVLDINPNAIVETRDILLNEQTIPQLFQEHWASPPDLALDAIDSLGPKVSLLAALLEHHIPVISSMGAALRTDPTQIRSGRLTEVTHCPLSAQLRKRIRRLGVNTDDISCIFSTEPVRADLKTQPERIIPPDRENERPQGNGRLRNTLGSLPTITGIFGLFLANEAILRLLS